MRVYRCLICKLAWFEDQVIKSSDGKAFCRQDGSRLRDITKSNKAQRLLRIRERQEQVTKKEG